MVEIKDVEYSDVERLSQQHYGALDETRSLQKTLETDEVIAENEDKMTEMQWQVARSAPKNAVREIQLR